jgi:hypothetical protein
MGYLGYFHILPIVNYAIINMHVQESLLYPDLHSFGYIPRSGIAGSNGSVIFSFLRSLVGSRVGEHSCTQCSVG